MATIKIPTPLRGYVENKDVIEVEGNTVGEILSNLITTYPKLKNYMYDNNGNLRTFIRLFAGDEDIDDLEGLDTVIEGRIELNIVPAIAGGIYMVRKNI